MDATHVIASLWDSSVCRAGDPGSQLVGSFLSVDPAVGVIESSSACRLATSDSKSII
jgi:hypothetical protein